MNEYRVLLAGRQQADFSAGEAVGVGEQLDQLCIADGSSDRQFVKVRLARSAKLCKNDLELSLVSKMAVVGLATVGMLGALSGSAQAAQQVSLPCVPTSSSASFTPSDHSRQAQHPSETAAVTDSYEVSALEPLSDGVGNPVLFAAFHRNTQVQHSNAATTHSNGPWANHSNQGNAHQNSAWTNHANGESNGSHINMVHGDFVF